MRLDAPFARVTLRKNFKQGQQITRIELIIFKFVFYFNIAILSTRFLRHHLTNKNIEIVFLSRSMVMDRARQGNFKFYRM